jgi:O-antigen/teichoic acid export membrane protein
MSLLSVILVARLLDETGFALYVLVHSAIFFPFLICTALWANPTLVFLPKRFAVHPRSYGRAIFFCNGLTISAISLLTLVSFHLFYRRLEPLIALSAWLASIGWSHYDCRRRMAYAVHRGPVILAPSVSILATYLLIMFSAWQTGRLTVYTAFFALAASYFLADALAGFLLRLPQVEVEVGESPTVAIVAVSHWRYARWTLASIPPAWMCNQGYFILAGVYLTDAALGGFRSVHVLLSSTSVITAVFVNHSLPRASEVLHRDGLGAFKRFVDLMFTRTWLPFLGLQLVAASASFLVFGKLYGERYASAIGLIPILAVYQFVSSLRLPVEVAWSAQEKLFVPFAGHLVSAVVSGTLGILLINRAQATGAAVGLLLTGSTNLSILYFALRRELQSRSRAPRLDVELSGSRVG